MMIMVVNAASAAAATTIHMRDFICMPPWTGWAEGVNAILRLSASFMVSCGHNGSEAATWACCQSTWPFWRNPLVLGALAGRPVASPTSWASLHLPKRLRCCGCAQLKLKALVIEQIGNDLKKVLRLRITLGSQHTHQTFGRAMRGRCQLAKSDRGIDAVA